MFAQYPLRSGTSKRGQLTLRNGLHGPRTGVREKYSSQISTFKTIRRGKLVSSMLAVNIAPPGTLVPCPYITRWTISSG